jgi:hypothetical protein
MTRRIAALLCVLVPFVTSAGAQTGTPGSSGVPPTTRAGTYQIQPVKELRKGVELWPLIVNPGNPAEQRVNATLTKLNNRLTQALKDCDARVLEQSKQMGDTAKSKDPTSDDWSREVQVTMQGPRFLSLLATDDSFCGGAYPDSGQMALVFDMTTGAPVNWMALVAKSAGASTHTDTVMDGSTAGALILPALQKMNLAAAGPDCKDAFQDPQSFLLWPDAKSGTLVAMPFDLPHATQACASQINLTIGQARKLGFSESLLGAIEQANRQSGVTPKP